MPKRRKNEPNMKNKQQLRRVDRVNFTVVGERGVRIYASFVALTSIHFGRKCNNNKRGINDNHLPCGRRID